jgi:hypothetical protein
MVDIVIGDQSYYFPSEMVQGAYGALKALGFDLGDVNVDLPIKILEDDEEIPTGVTDFVVSCGNFFLLYQREQFQTRSLKISKYCKFLLQGICGVYNVLGRHIKPFILDPVSDDIVGKTVPADISNYRPEKSTVTQTVTFPRSFPPEVVDLITMQADQQTRFAIQDAMGGVTNLNKTDRIIRDLIGMRRFYQVLVIAVQNGDEALFDYVLQNYYIRNLDEALQLAVEFGQLNIVKRFERLGIDPFTIFYYACGYPKALNIVKNYVPRQGDGSIDVKLFSRGVGRAISSCNNEILKYLITLQNPYTKKLDIREIYQKDCIDTFQIIFSIYPHDEDLIRTMIEKADSYHAEKIKKYLQEF